MNSLTINTEPREVARLLAIYTGGRISHYSWSLTGPAKASCRAHIMSEIIGRKATQRESGINALESALFLVFEPMGDCLASRRDHLAKLCRGLLEAGAA